MHNIIVNIAEMEISDDPDVVLVTYSLGSCLGIVCHDPVRRIAGLIHCMLPLSQIDPEKAAVTPCMFVDTGLPRMLNAMLQLGCLKTNLVIKVAGGAAVLDSKGLFRIGERNYAVLRKILWKNSLMIAAEEVGGDIPRTVRVEVATGRVSISSHNQEREL